MDHPGIEVARRQRVAVFVVAYRDDARMEETLRRIPESLLRELTALYVIDDRGRAAEPLEAHARPLGARVQVLRTPFAKRYGANLKLGFRYAIRQGFDVIALLHADGKYAPEALPDVLAPFARPEVAAVQASRMLDPAKARAAGMPLVRWIGNRGLTAIQNRLLGSRLSEFHSGYRAYRVDELARLPFQYNTDGHAFETEILIQLLGRGARIVEVPTPVFYGGDLVALRGARYALECLASTLRAAANRLHLVYHPRFDLEGGPGRGYGAKHAPTSLHQHVLRRSPTAGRRVADLGAGDGSMGSELHRRGARVVAVDVLPPERPVPFPFLVRPLDPGFSSDLAKELDGRADLVLALDVLEHLEDPERCLAEIARLMVPGGRLLASTANVAYLPIRLSLLSGQFNYGKRGILDITHRRLFTVRSFRRALRGEGFRVDRVRGFGPPIQDVIGRSRLLVLLDRVAGGLARLWPSLLAYQFLVEATRLDSVDDLMPRPVDDRD